MQTKRWRTHQKKARTNKLECYTNAGWRGEFQMCNKSEITNSSKTIQFPRSKIWEALLATDQARSVMKQSSCVLVRRKGVWLTLWVRFRCFAIWQRPTPSPVSFRFIVVRQPSSSHASLLSVRRSRSLQVIIHGTGDIRGVCSRDVCVYTPTDLDQTQIRLMCLWWEGFALTVWITTNHLDYDKGQKER